MHRIVFKNGKSLNIKTIEADPEAINQILQPIREFCKDATLTDLGSGNRRFNQKYKINNYEFTVGPGGITLTWSQVASDAHLCSNVSHQH